MCSARFLSIIACPRSCLALTLVLFVLPWQGAPGAALVVPKAPEIDANAWILTDFDSGRVLAESGADERLEPASLTKIMTAFVVFSEMRAGNIALDDKVRVSKKAYKTPGSRMFIEIDSEVSVENLLHGMIIQSGNDSSVALAEFVAGDEQVFAALMNEYAKQLGMSGSNFENSTGLPGESHYTTGRDLATLARALIREFPDLYRWHALKQFEWNNIVQKNRNRLLWIDKSVDGIKTGHTSSAGFCLVASALREDMRLISVVLGAKSAGARTRQTSTLLNYGFRFFETHRLYAARKPVTSVRVWKGQRENLSVGLSRDLYVTVPRGQYKKLDADVEMEADIMAPVRAGETKGRVILKLGQETLAERPLIALEPVAQGSVWRRLTDNVKLLFR